tara:strand:- start:257 stop:556 length:300 start_codon:yes stop_codon:yes gene_type:complete
MKPNLFDAIHSLVGGTLTGSPNDFSSFQYQSGQTPPTEKEAEAKLAELEAEWDAQAYARARQPLYPEIGDQLDDLYHKGAFSDEMSAKIKKVKDDNPKP